MDGSKKDLLSIIKIRRINIRRFININKGNILIPLPSNLFN